MIRRPTRHARSTAFIPVRTRPVPLDAAPALSVVATKMRLTFTEPVVISGIPNVLYTKTFVDYNPTAVTVVSPIALDLTYSLPVTTVSAAYVRPRDPAVRNHVGGFMVPGQHAL